MKVEELETVIKWSKKLTKEQMSSLLVQLVDHLHDIKHIRVGDLAPYWEACGEPLVPGQQPWKDD